MDSFCSSIFKTTRNCS